MPNVKPSCAHGFSHSISVSSFLLSLIKVCRHLPFQTGRAPSLTHVMHQSSTGQKWTGHRLPLFPMQMAPHSFRDKMMSSSRSELSELSVCVIDKYRFRNGESEILC